MVPIIGTIPVNVMNSFVLGEFSPKRFFYNLFMLIDVFIITNPNPNITVIVNVSPAFPSWVFMPRPGLMALGPIAPPRDVKRFHSPAYGIFTETHTLSNFSAK